MKRNFLIFLFSFLCICISFLCASVNKTQQVCNFPYVKVLFTPQDNCVYEINKIIDKAKQSIHIAMYYFTSRPIASALVKAKNRGVDVKVCFDKEQEFSQFSKAQYFVNKKIPLRFISGSGKMHNKFCIVDGHIVITGSYNWTTTAELENDENLLVIDSFGLAQQYEKEFQSLWEGTKIDSYEYRNPQRFQKIPLPGRIISSKPSKAKKIKIISWKKANKHYGEFVIVKGKIVKTYNSGKICYLNFSFDWKNNLTAIIFSSDFDKFPPNPEKFYFFKNVEIRGVIKKYKNRPEIILKQPFQIRIID